VAFWAAISLSWAIAPDIAVRRWTLVIIVIFLSVSLCALVNSVRQIHLVALAATGAVMLANYFVTFAIPEIGLSSEERGVYWSGLLPHKNSAGLVSAIAFVIWLFAWRRFFPSWIILGGASLWLIFLMQTGSRTSQFASMVAVVCTVLLSYNNRHLRRVALFTILFGIFSILIGLLPAESVLQTLFGDTTFTGRTLLWSFLVAQIFERPFHGVGIGSFWGVNQSGLRYAGDDWFAKTFQGHNGYLDVTVTLGIIGLALSFMFILSPIRSLLKADARIDLNSRVYCAIWIFALIHNCAESTLLRGDSILWVLTIISIIVLRSRAWQPSSASIQSPNPVQTAIRAMQSRTKARVL
jgi:O-antigen ligase